MDIDEHIALRMARERIEEAVQAAEQRRALRNGRAHSSAGLRLGGALLRLGRWVKGHP